MSLVPLSVIKHKSLVAIILVAAYYPAKFYPALVVTRLSEMQQLLNQLNAGLRFI